MNENNNFALARKPQTEIEEAAPGAKRVLSGMVAETLELARQATGKQVTVSDAQLEDWYRTGEKYYFGHDVAKNEVEAIKWFRKAAEQNHAQAQRSLGNCFWFGKGVEKDFEEALKWYRKAAERNDAGAEFRLGYCYREGEGVSKSYAEAVKWFRRAAEHGSGRQAEYNLGALYEKGEGVAKDYEEAVKWYQKAADANHAQAQHDLGDCYENGRGVQRGLLQAYKLYKLAANNGHWPFEERKIYLESLERVARRMTATELYEGERLYREHLRSHPEFPETNF